MTISNTSTILIVDDIAENLQVLGKILSENKYEINIAQSGKEALESTQEILPDLILLDINMPEMDGYEVCNILKSTPLTQNIPVIFLTANHDIDKIVKGFEVGAVDYVTKPFQTKELLSRIKTHLDLIHTKNVLMETIAIKNKFFKIIAHDLRSPFNALIGFSNLLISKQELDQEKKDMFIEVINETSKKGLGLLENLLLWAESQTNEIHQNKEKINLKLSCESVIQLLKFTALHKEISIENLISPDIFVSADPRAVETIFRNLISNAIKFTHKKGKILIQAYAQDKIAHISVSDNGIGMKKEIITNLFSFNEKITSLGTEEEKGSGLGLMLVKDFVEKNNGQISIESTIDKGTTITFTLEHV